MSEKTEEPPKMNFWLGEGILVQTPRSLSIKEWETLRNYVSILKPYEVKESVDDEC